LLNEAASDYYKYQDEDSLQKVVESAKGLIYYFVRLYGGGCTEEDLFQTGNLGLLKALKSYNSSREVSFVTYASHFIMGEIRHLVRKQGSYYRPGCIVELQHKVDRVVEEYTMIHGNVPSTAYIAEKLKIKEESVNEVMKAGMVSFDEIDAAKIHSSTYENFHLPIEDKLILFKAIKKLSDIQQKVIYMLFYHDMTQQQVAEKLGMSQKQVSRVKGRSVQMLKADLDEKFSLN
jgi:RNA polymerase sigma-B factor